jgi:hypothetical protein
MSIVIIITQLHHRIHFHNQRNYLAFSILRIFRLLLRTECLSVRLPKTRHRMIVPVVCSLAHDSTKVHLAPVENVPIQFEF